MSEIIQRLKKFTLLDFRILSSGLISLTSTIGYIRGFTVLVPALKEYLKCEDKVVSLFPSFLLLGFAVAGLFIGYLIPKYGTRNLVIIGGIMTIINSVFFAYLIKSKRLLSAYLVTFLLIGIPEGFMLTCCFDSARKFGTKMILGMIVTFISAGSSIGALVLPPLYQLVLDKTGSVVQTLYLIAVFQKGSNIVAGFLLPYDGDQRYKGGERESQCHVEKPKFFSKSLLATPSYYTFVIGTILFLIGYTSTITFIKSLLSSYQLPDQQIYIYLSLLGIIELCSRIIFAVFLVDAYNPINLLGISYFGDGAACLVLSLAMLFQKFLLKFKIIILYFGIVIFGFFNSGFMGLSNATLIKILPPEKFSVGLGMFQLISGVGNSLGPLLSGSLVDALRNNETVTNTNSGSNSTWTANDQINLYEDPYWAIYIFSSFFCMLPAGFVILSLKRWFPT